MNCPIPKNDNAALSLMINVPSNVPKMTYNIKAVATSYDGKRLLCINGDIKIQ